MTNKRLSFGFILFLLVILANSSSNFANAQAVFGIKAGVNGSTIVGADADALGVVGTDGNVVKASPKLGFQLGIFAQLQITEQLTFRPEIQLSEIGVRYSQVQINSFKANLQNTYYYIDLPLLLQWQGNSNFKIIGGAQISYLAQAQSAQARAGELDLNYGVDMVKFPFSAVLEVGYDLPANLSVGLRAQYGISTVTESFDNEVIGLHHLAVMFNVGYVFPQLIANNRYSPKGYRRGTGNR